MQRKFIFSIISLSIIFSLVGCQTSTENNTQSANSRPGTDTAVSSDSAAEKSTESDSVLDKDETVITDEDKKEIDTVDTENIPPENNETETDETEEEHSKPSYSIQIGGYTLNAEKIKTEKPLKVTDRDYLDCVLFGDSLYVLNDKSVTNYKLTDSSAKKGDTVKLDYNYKKIDADPYGGIYLSNDIFNIARLENDGTVTELENTGNLALSKVMEYGLNFFDGGKNIFRFEAEDSDDSFFEEPDDSEESVNVFDSIEDIEFVGNHILIGGTADGKNMRVAVYDYDGNRLAVTDNKIDGNGIDAMTETDSGLMVSSMGNLSLWNSDGSEITQTKSSETAKLFGSNNPVRISKLIAMDDGNILALCSVESEKNKYETALYRISGF